MSVSEYVPTCPCTSLTEQLKYVFLHSNYVWTFNIDHIKALQITSQNLSALDSLIQLAAHNTQIRELSLHPNPPRFVLPCRGIGKVCENRLADSRLSL